MRFALGMLLCLVAGPTFAQDDPAFGELGFGGTGCPAGGGRPAYATTTDGLRVTFEQFGANAGGQSGRPMDRQSCNLSIPVDVPEGRSLAVTEVSYSGVTELGVGATGDFSIEVFFTGGRGETHGQRFRGERQGLFARTEPIAEPVWSACGAPVLLRLNASFRVTTTGGRPAMISLQSQWHRPAIALQIEWRDC